MEKLPTTEEQTSKIYHLWQTRFNNNQVLKTNEPNVNPRAKAWGIISKNEILSIFISWVLQYTEIDMWSLNTGMLMRHLAIWEVDWWVDKLLIARSLSLRRSDNQLIFILLRNTIFNHSYYVQVIGRSNITTSHINIMLKTVTNYRRVLIQSSQLHFKR